MPPDLPSLAPGGSLPLHLSRRPYYPTALARSRSASRLPSPSATPARCNRRGGPSPAELEAVGRALTGGTRCDGASKNEVTVEQKDAAEGTTPSLKSRPFLTLRHLFSSSPAAPSSAATSSKPSPRPHDTAESSPSSPTTPTTFRQRTRSKLAALLPKQNGRPQHAPPSIVMPPSTLDFFSALTTEGASPQSFVSATDSPAPEQSPALSPSSAESRPRFRRAVSDTVSRLRSGLQCSPVSPSYNSPSGLDGLPAEQSIPASPDRSPERRFAHCEFDMEPPEFPFPKQPIDESPFFDSSGSATSAVRPAPPRHTVSSPIDHHTRRFHLRLHPPSPLSCPPPRPSSRTRRSRSFPHQQRPLNRRRTSSSGSISASSTSVDQPGPMSHIRHPYLHPALQPQTSFSTFSSSSPSLDQLSRRSVASRRSSPESYSGDPRLASHFSDWTPTPPDSSHASLASLGSAAASLSFTSQHELHDQYDFDGSSDKQRYRPLLTYADRRQALLRRKHSAPGLLDFASFELGQPLVDHSLAVPVPIVRTQRTLDSETTAVDVELDAVEEDPPPTRGRRERSMTSVAVQASGMVSIGVQSSPPWTPTPTVSLSPISTVEGGTASGNGTATGSSAKTLDLFPLATSATALALAFPPSPLSPPSSPEEAHALEAGEVATEPGPVPPVVRTARSTPFLQAGRRGGVVGTVEGRPCCCREPCSARSSPGLVSGGSEGSNAMLDA
ncbi:hypothetical protein JCM8097_001143 [Rhodosporidiobolus ruineniae]